MTKASALFTGLDAKILGGDLDAIAPALVTIDSRKVKAGAVFVACPGALPTSKHGHDFLDAAVKAGASVLVVEDEAKGAPLVGHAAVVVVKDARKAAAILAERVHGEPSKKLKLVGITGTNGKTTTTWLTAQLCAHAGMKAAVLGTLGVGDVNAPKSLGFTTPEAEILSGELAKLVDEGFQVVAMEVSSHALATARVDGMTFAATGFTNLTRDHLDFHGTMDAYFDAKARLFVGFGGEAAVPAFDDEGGWNARLRALAPKARTWGRGGDLDVVDVQFGPRGMTGALVEGKARVPFTSPLLGTYNVENLLVAASCARALGLSLEQIAAGLATAKAPPGRLERVDGADGGPTVVVDYAHTPDALERALHVMRGVCAGKLTVVFGCGGDRDPGKRPLMGRIAADIADVAVITDDNPRSEDGSAIAAAVEQGIGDRKRKVDARDLERGTYAVERARRMAIRAAIDASEDDDVVLVAGKGHEKTQTIGQRVLPFDDVTEARSALRHESSPAILDTQLVVDGLAARGVQAASGLPPFFVGVSTDSRKVVPGSLFVALKGENFDAHRFVSSSVGAGKASAALVAKDKLGELDGVRALIAVDDTLLGLKDIARAYLATLPGRRVQLTGSNGKTTTKELIAGCLRAAWGGPWVHATEGNFNNHVGVPLTVFQCHPEHKAMVFETGMNHLGEIAYLADIVQPEVGLITNIGTAHAGNVGGIEGVAKAKAELWEALKPSSVAVVNADDPRCVREAQAKAKCRHVAFGRAPWADVRLTGVRDRENGGQDLEITYGGKTVETSIGLDGRHNAQNAVGAVAVAVALGLDFETCARGLATAHHAHGRLERVTLPGNVWLLDDTYNANPDSMEAAIGTLGELAGARRKIIVLGEMRELGQYAESAHRHIGAAAAQAQPALVFACGDMAKLYGEGAVRVGLPSSSFIWARDNAALAPLVVSAVTDGDVVLVKGSRGARMEVVVDALKRARGKG
jgi:murE/murF fusion protein